MEAVAPVSVIADRLPSGADHVPGFGRVGGGVDVLDDGVPGDFEAFVEVGGLVPGAALDCEHAQGADLRQRVPMPQFGIRSIRQEEVSRLARGVSAEPVRRCWRLGEAAAGPSRREVRPGHGSPEARKAMRVSVPSSPGGFGPRCGMVARGRVSWLGGDSGQEAQCWRSRRADAAEGVPVG